MATWTPSNTWFLGPTQVQNGISIGLAIFAGFTTVTDRLTDLAESVTIGRSYVRSTATSVCQPHILLNTKYSQNMRC